MNHQQLIRRALATTGSILALGTLFSLSSVTGADARPSTRSYTCQAVQDLVQRRGAVVMNTKNARVYRRFVANRSYCASSEITETRTVPTKTGGCYLRICWEPLSRGSRFRRGN